MATREGRLERYLSGLWNLLISVPVRIKVMGIMVFPVLLMGLALNYWVRTGLSDWLSYLLTDERVEVAMAAGGRSVLLVSVLAAFISILLTSFLMYVLTQPLLELSRAATKVTRGELGTRARVWAQDEIGNLAQSVNTMIDRLVAGRQDLQRRNRQLQALNQVAMAAAQKNNIHDVLYQILAGILDILKIDMGWIYLYDPERHKYHLASWYGVDDEFKAKILATEEECWCACQRGMLEGTLPPDAGFVECKRIDQYGINHHVSFLARDEQPLGIMLLACRQTREFLQEEIELLDLVGAQISEIVSNAWLEMKLSEKEMLRQQLLQALVKAQEDERSRLARELHDGAGQNLTSLLVRMKALEKQVDEGHLRTSIQGVCTDVSEMIEYIRALSHQLRPAILEQIGLEKAIYDLVESLGNEAAIDWSVHVDLGGIAMPAEIETTVYRIAQECLTNVLRHAGADQVRVSLVCDLDMIVIEIQDNGRGFDESEIKSAIGRQRLGIQGMRERIELFAGRLYVESKKGAGTLIRGELPVLVGVLQ